MISMRAAIEHGRIHGAVMRVLGLLVCCVLTLGVHAQDDLMQARTALATGDYADAIATANRHIEANPDSNALFTTLGLALLATGELEPAKQAFSKAVELQAPDKLSAEHHLALISYRRGELGEAYAQFERVLDYYRGGLVSNSSDLTSVAKSTAYLGITRPAMYKAAVDLFLEANVYDKENDEARLALGNLLLDKYNNTEAMDVFDEVLSRDPDDPRALLGLARSQHFDHSSEAMLTVQRALAANPNLVPAQVFVAKLHIESEQYADALAAANAALAINPVSLEALAVLAAVHFVTRDVDAFEDVVRKTLALNPRYAELYSTLAELAADNRLYRDAVAFAEKAVELDQHSWRGFGLLGVNELRVGAISSGIANLEKAFEGDPYNVWIKNTLDLTDTFPEYKVDSSERFKLMLHESENALLQPYLLPLAEATFEEFSERYGYTPDTPMRIEFYPQHADFSVRTVGLAGVGILGVCFGPVVAMDSPSARTQGSFNWGSTLRHELAHSFHLGMTDHRVPRWFSEGLAVHEERRGRDGWGGDLSLDFLAAMRDDKLLPVSRLNDGFVRPSYPEQVIHAYYQASLVLEFIEQKWGFPAIRTMLDQFKEGNSSAHALGDALGITPDAFDEQFDEYLNERFSRALASLIKHEDAQAMVELDADALLARAQEAPDDFGLSLTAGAKLLSEDDFERAEPILLSAQTLIPEYAGNDSPYWLLASLYQRRGDESKAAKQLEQMVAINAEHYEAHVTLADLKIASAADEEAADLLDRAIYIYPYEIELHEKLAELYSKLGRHAMAVRERAAVIALDPVDMAGAQLDLASAYLAAGDTRAAKRETLKALELAPNFEAAQDLLLDIRERDAN